MTELNILKLKLIQATLEAVDIEDAKDAAQAMQMIRAILYPGCGDQVDNRK